jgi:hypothetical protein
VDGKLPKRYSSRIELKCLAMKFAQGNDMNDEDVGSFLLEVDRLKSKGSLSDAGILFKAYRVLIKGDGGHLLE